MWEVPLVAIGDPSGCLVSKVFLKGVQAAGSAGMAAVQDVDRFIAR